MFYATCISYCERDVGPVEPVRYDRSATIWHRTQTNSISGHTLCLSHSAGTRLLSEAPFPSLPQNRLTVKDIRYLPG